MSKIKTLIFAIRRGKILQVLADKYKSDIDTQIKNNRINYWTKLTSERCKLLPKCRLSESETHSISTYWGTANTLFHHFYKAATGKFDVKCIPDDIYYTQIDPYFNDWSEGACLDNKIFYRLFFPNIKQPPLIAYRWNGYWYDNAAQPTSIEAILELISSKGQTCFIKVAKCSMGGHGIEVINGSRMSIAKMSNIVNSMAGDLVIQEKIIQSDITAKLNESSVNTIRVMTFLRKDGSVKLCSSCLRMGMAGSMVDNASSGGITVGINASTGKLNDTAYSPAGISYDRHPTSDVKFSDIILPNFGKVIENAKLGALNMPQFRLISWDFAIDKNLDPVLIEANLYVGELEFHQLNNGPIFGDETDEILKEISLNPKKIKYPF